MLITRFCKRRENNLIIIFIDQLGLNMDLFNSRRLLGITAIIRGPLNVARKNAQKGKLPCESLVRFSESTKTGLVQMIKSCYGGQCAQLHLASSQACHVNWMKQIN